MAAISGGHTEPRDAAQRCACDHKLASGRPPRTPFPARPRPSPQPQHASRNELIAVRDPETNYANPRRALPTQARQLRGSDAPAPQGLKTWIAAAPRAVKIWIFNRGKIIDGAIVSVLSARIFTSKISRTLSLFDFKFSRTLSHCFSHCFHTVFHNAPRPNFHVRIFTSGFSRPNIHGLRRPRPDACIASKIAEVRCERSTR